MSKTAAEGRRNRTARAYLAALDRLIEGKALIPITPDAPFASPPPRSLKKLAAAVIRSTLRTARCSPRSKPPPHVLSRRAISPQPSLDSKRATPSCEPSSGNCGSTSAIWQPRTCRCSTMRVWPRIGSPPETAKSSNSSSRPLVHPHSARHASKRSDADIGEIFFAALSGCNAARGKETKGIRLLARCRRAPERPSSRHQTGKQTPRGDGDAYDLTVRGRSHTRLSEVPLQHRRPSMMSDVPPIRITRVSSNPADSSNF